jgi:peptidoglycan lytic transglycosylase G
VTSSRIWQFLRGHARLVATLVLSFLLIGSVLVLRFADRAISAPLDLPPDGLVLTIESGKPFRRVAADLHEEGFLAHPRVLEWYARVTGKARRIKVGEYAVAVDTSGVGLIEQLIAGRVILHRFTIVEGWRTADVLMALATQDAITSTGVSEADVMAALGEPDVHPEGQFLPDTYSFPRGTTDRELLRQAHAALQATLAAAWAARSPDAVASSPYHALVLASIIEKETALASERRQISGVFNRRLERGIRLQADPTVIYGLGKAFDGNLRTVDLETDTPYNTYTRRGLPPTPIAIPGADAIEAALDPAPGDEIYFVATGDGDGSHYFSATLEEHNAAVQRYLAKLRGSRN